jgi:hypothetical protein
MAGRDAALRRPVGAARRPYFSEPPSLADYNILNFVYCIPIKEC